MPLTGAGEAQALARNRWIRALERTAGIADAPLRTLPVVIEELAEAFGDRAALLSDKEILTFRQLVERSNRYSRWALAQGLAPGQVVCLMMPNCPDYFAAWIGITRVGGVVALVNTDLRGTALAHCVSVVAPAHAIVAPEHEEIFAQAIAGVAEAPAVWCEAATGGRPALGLDSFDAAGLGDRERRPVTLADHALYIYTSGTTGLPKAAKVSHHRVMMWSHWFAGMMQIGSQDRMYNCLPMYHSVGGIVAVASVLVGGGSVVLREHFSASRFWSEVARWECTLFQYIGELCRYLVNAPADPAAAGHRLRLCCGNGLRREVWDAFVARFRIPAVLEFYAATEGNFSLYNAEGQPGSVGRIPPFLAHRFPAAIVRFDVATGLPARDEQGRCIRCERNEAGEAIGRIRGEGQGAAFEGYSEAGENERKVLRDVFAEGDAWFRTGDLMRQDEKGFFYFVDRIGDTFRWKGENVSTAEVAEAIMACRGVSEAVVYGVAVPGTDGRAGMAALITDDTVDLDHLHGTLAATLPAYARPLFLRLAGGLAITGTFKPKKHELARDGFDPAASADEVYYDDRRAGRYVRLDRVLFEAIAGGQLRV